MHHKHLLITVFAVGTLALAAGGCKAKTDDSYEGKVKSDSPSGGANPGATPSRPGARPSSPATAPAKPMGKSPQVMIKTSLGNIHLELNAEKAPITVKNYLRYVQDKFYDNTIFHRVMPNFMIQGGGLTHDMQKKSTRAPIKNEAKNGLSTTRGTVAMARTPNPHSAQAQFFVNVKDNAFLNHKGKSQQGWGYCVFGKVTAGMKLVDTIKKLSTGSGGPFGKDVPTKPVMITKAKLL